MADKTNRRWYKKRRIIGSVLGTVALALASVPGAPVLASVGAIAITTQTASILIGGIGTYVFGYGRGRHDPVEGQGAPERKTE